MYPQMALVLYYQYVKGDTRRGTVACSQPTGHMFQKHDNIAQKPWESIWANLTS